MYCDMKLISAGDTDHKGTDQPDMNIATRRRKRNI